MKAVRSFSRSTRPPKSTSITRARRARFRWSSGPSTCSTIHTQRSMEGPARQSGKNAGIACTLPSVFSVRPRYGGVDWFTHIFTAVALALVLRANRKVALAMAFGAMAPDLDALLTPVTILAPQLWFLDHRTFSHSLLLGLPWALGATWVFQRPVLLQAWRRIFRVDISLRIDRTIVLPMFAGVLLHILMDMLTIQGPALFAPISATRFQLDLFYFIDVAPLAVSSPLLVLSLWRLGT